MFDEKNLTQLREFGFTGPVVFLKADEVKILKEKILKYKRWIFESGFSMNQVLNEAAHLTYKKELIEFLIKYFDDDVVSLGSRPFLGGGNPGKAIPWHHEMDFGRIFGNNVKGVQTWLSLDEANLDNGALQVIQKSHLIKELDPVNVYGKDIFQSKKNLHAHSIGALKEKLEKHIFEITTFNAKPGQLFLFDWKVLHRSSPYKKFSARRLTINARYVSQSENFTHDWFNMNSKFICSEKKLYQEHLLNLKNFDLLGRKNSIRLKTYYNKMLKKVNLYNEF